MADVIGELQIRVDADIAQAEAKIGVALPASLERSATRVKELQAALASDTGASFGDVLTARVERATRVLDVAKQRASELSATLAGLKTEQASLVDFTTRAAKGPQFVTSAEVTQFSPALMSGRLEQLTGTDQSKGLIEKTEAALGTRILQVSKSQDRLGDLLAQNLTRNRALATSAATEIQKQEQLAVAAASRVEQRVARGFGQGIIRGAGAGLGLPLYYGLATIGGLLAGELIGKAFSAANEKVEKTTASLAALRAQTGLSVEGTAKFAAAAEAAGVSLDALGTAETALHGKGVAFDDAITKLRSIRSDTERAAEATRLFGAEQAKAIAPLLTQQGPTDPGQQQRAQYLADLQRIDQLNKALDARSGGGGSTFVLTGLVDLARQAGSGLQLLTQQTKVQNDAEIAFRESHPGAAYEEIYQAGLDAVAGFRQGLRASADFADQLDHVAAIAEKFSGAQNAGTQSLIGMSAAATAADQALRGVGTAMDAAERKALGISTSISGDLLQAFNKLSAFGAILPDTATAVRLLVQADVDPASLNAIFEQLQGVGDLAGSSIADSINKSLAGGLTAIGQNRLQGLLSVQEQRESIAQRISDIEDGIAERHAQNAKVSFDFSKAELDQKLKDREAEHAFFSFRERGTPTDFSKQDARDRRQIADLQKQLADSERVHPDLGGEINRAEALRDSLDSIANIITGAKDLTLTHKVVVTLEGGETFIGTREDVLNDKAALLAVGRFVVTAATAGKRIVENTRPSNSTVPVGGGGGGQLVR